MTPKYLNLVAPEHDPLELVGELEDDVLVLVVDDAFVVDEVLVELVGVEAPFWH